MRLNSYLPILNAREVSQVSQSVGQLVSTFWYSCIDWDHKTSSVLLSSHKSTYLASTRGFRTRKLLQYNLDIDLSVYSCSVLSLQLVA